MADEAKANAGRPLTWMWMVLALLVVGGFLTWLGVASERTTVAVIEEQDEETALATGEVVVERDTLAVSRSRFLDQTVRVQGVEATGILGPGMFWGELGDPTRQIPVLIRMDRALVGETTVEVGRAYTISGRVNEMTEDLADEWARAGEFRGEGEHMQAMFADYYLQAGMVRPTGGARPEAGR